MKDFTREFEKIRGLDPRPRGLKFEQLFYDIFEEHGILIDRSFKTEDGLQQIDGSIEIKNKIFIVETKWERTETLASQKLMAFIGKINSKIVGTLGLFISYNGLRKKIITTARAGIRQNCIIINGEENILPIIHGEVPVADYAWYIFKQASTRNKVTAPISDFLKSETRLIVVDKWDEVRDALISEDDKGDFEEKLDRYLYQIDDLSERAIRIYPKLKEKGLDKKLDYLLDSIIDNKGLKLKLYDALIKKLASIHWIKYAYEDILDRTKNLFELDETKAEKIAENAIAHLRKYNSNYDQENKASRVIDFVYDYLSEEYNAKLACAYANIYCDRSRKDRFEQKQMAYKIFRDIKREDRWAKITDLVKEFIAENKSRNDLRLNPEQLKEDVVEDVYRKYEKIINESDPKNLERKLARWYDQA